MSQATNRVDCPICGRSFSAAFVNEHVNKCLNSTQPSLVTSAGGQIEIDSGNKSPTGDACFPDTSPGTLSKRTASNGNAGVARNPQISSALNILKRSSSNLAGKSNSNPPLKKHKSQETAATSKSPENKKADHKEPVSSLHSNSYFPDTKSKDSRKAQKSKANQFTPLAERMRPKTLSEYVGQSQVLGNNSLLRTLLEANEIPSMIFWGPPGCGKVLIMILIIIIISKSNLTQRSTIQGEIQFEIMSKINPCIVRHENYLLTNFYNKLQIIFRNVF